MFVVALFFNKEKQMSNSIVSIISGKKERTQVITRFFLYSGLIELRGYSTDDCTIDLEVPTFATRRPVVSASENLPVELCLEW